MEEKRLTTQKKLAVYLGVSEGAVNNWLLGNNRPAPAVLEKMAESASDPLAAYIRQEIRDYAWHRKKTKGRPAATVEPPARANRRFSGETTSLLHQALDIILDRAPTAAVEKVTEFLNAFAGKYGSERERSARAEPRLLPSEFDAEVERLAHEQGLDTSHILRDALSLGLAALSSDLTVKRQTKINKEVYRRANPRS